MEEQSSQTVFIWSALSFLSFLFTEPERMFLYISRKWIGHSGSGEMSDARLPGNLPYLPVCGVCLQPGRSHGPDSLCHHPHQVVFPLLAPTHYRLSENWELYHLCFSFRTVSPELKSYALGVLFLLLRLLGEYFLSDNAFLFHRAYQSTITNLKILSIWITFGVKSRFESIELKRYSVFILNESPHFAGGFATTAQWC